MTSLRIYRLDKEVGRQSGKTIIDYLFGILLFIAITLVLSPPAKNIFQVTDLSEFYCGAALYFAGRAKDIYDVAQFFPYQIATFPALGTRAIPLYVGPWALPFLLPLLVFPAAHAYFLVKILLLALFLLGLCLLMKTFKMGSRVFMWLGAVLPFTGPVWEALRIEQLSAFLFLSLALHLYFVRRGSEKWWPAALFLLPFLLKPHLALTIFAFHLGALRLRFALYFALLCGAFLLFSWFYCGEAYRGYFSLFQFSMLDLTWMNPEATPTLRGQLLRLPFWGKEAAVWINTLSSIVFALTLLATTCLGAAFRKACPARATALMAVPLGLVLSLHCYSYDLVLLLPALILTLKPVMQSRFLPAWSYLLGFVVPALCFTLPFYALIHYILTLQGSAVNYHFLALSILTGYLLSRGKTLLPSR